MHSLRRHAVSQAAAAALGLTSVLFTSHAGGQVVERGVMQPVQSRTAAAAGAPAQRGQRQAAAAQSAPRLACTAVTAGEPISLALGKSRLIQLQSPAIRLIGGGRPSSSVGAAGETTRQATPATPGMAAAAAGAPGSDGVADTEITLLSPTEMLVVGRRPGSANVIIQDREGRCVVRDITVTVDPQTLEGTLRQLVPNEPGVRVAAADNAIVLTGTVRDTSTLDQVMTVADVYGNGRRIVNLMRVSAPQQVMLEVKIAEVSKALIDRFGLDFARAVTSGGHTNIVQGIIGGQSAVLGRFGPNAPGSGNFTGSAVAGVASNSAAAAASISNTTRGASLLGIDVENRDGIFRVLAEPNIMAISGQSASFLSGGKIFIPVAQTSQGGGSTITLEEKEFGVGLKFTPTVLDGRINLKVISEVSELSQTGTPFTTVGGVTSVVPSMTTRRVDTTIQLADGQSFAVAGLIRNNLAEALNKFPGLGEAPVLGALFRSTEFQNDMTELMFVVTPRLVRPLAGPVTLPTDNHIVPSRADVILRGAGEGNMPLPPATPPTPAPLPAAPTTAPTPPQTPRPPGPTSELTPAPAGSIQPAAELATAPPPQRLVQAPEAQAVALAAPGAPLPEPQALPPLASLAPASAQHSDEQPHFE